MFHVETRKKLIKLDLVKLKYFHTIAKLENISQAAQILHVSQPALSKALSILETEMGVTLFFRNKKRLHLTPAGETVLRRAEKIFATIEDLEKELEELSLGEKAELKIISTLPYTFKNILGNFLKEYPDAQVKQSNLNAANLDAFIQRGAFDLCISTIENLDSSLEWTFLIEEDIFLSVPKNHPLAALEEVDITKIDLKPLVGLTPNYEFRHVMDNIFRKLNLKVNYQIEFEEPSSILQLTLNGIGMSFTPETSATYLDDIKHLKIINPGFKRKIGILTNKEYYQSYLTKEFIRHCQAYFKTNKKQC